MKDTDLFSKRQKQQQDKITDVYLYDELPHTLRVQIIYILRDLLGSDEDYKKHDFVRSAYRTIIKTLEREYGIFCISSTGIEVHHFFTHKKTLEAFIEKQARAELCLDAIELVFKYGHEKCRLLSMWDKVQWPPSREEYIDNCIIELNKRFREHGVGYEFIDGELIRIDSRLLHDEAVKPAIALLNREGFEGPRDEFFSAHEHYRNSKYKESLNDALKAFESMMKTICDRKSWTYTPSDTARKLIRVCINNGIFPTYYQNHLTSLTTLLESSVPTMRNKLSGHGQGKEISNIDPCVVAYTLHMTASVLVLLGELEKNE